MRLIFSLDMSASQFIATRLILPVRDIRETVEWYKHALAMTVVYVHGSLAAGAREPANFATMSRDQVEVHFILDERGPVWTRAGTGNLNLLVSNIEAIFARVNSLALPVLHGIDVQNWGARGFRLNDPSGNEILIEERA